MPHFLLVRAFMTPHIADTPCSNVSILTGENGCRLVCARGVALSLSLSISMPPLNMFLDNNPLTPLLVPSGRLYLTM